MSRKLYTPEQIIGKLREAEVALSALIRNLLHRQKASISISIPFGRKNSCHSRRQPTVPLPPPSEIFLPTDVGEDNKKISGIFPGKVIIVANGKVSSIHALLFPPNFFVSGPFARSEVVSKYGHELLHNPHFWNPLPPGITDHSYYLINFP